MRSHIDPVKLAEILPLVEKPGRYIGKEANSVYKENADVRVCWLFPDLYELGMSNTGIRLLYAMVNRVDWAWAERSYAPWPDMGKLMQENGIDLYSMETHTPLKNFDCLGITLQTEFAYTNILYCLELANINLIATERLDDEPLVMGGGPAVTNPEPMAEFFDFFLIGDGEDAMEDMLVSIRSTKGMPRKKRLEALSRIQGVYVPSLFDTFKNGHGEVLSVACKPENRTMRVKRTYAKQLDPSLYELPAIVPNLAPIHLRYGVEIMRGCTNGCRYCQAGYWYRPAREMDPDDVIQAVKAGYEATGLNEFGMLSLSTADYSRLEELVTLTARHFHGKSRINVALPSLRADKFTANLAMQLEDMHGQSLTFAPESGSEKLRRFINKDITDEQMFDAARACYENGWTNIKLYFMIGLPGETMENVQSIADLTAKILKIGKSVDKRKSVSVNVGVLSPKPCTAFQWDARATDDELDEKIELLIRELGKIRLRFHAPSKPHYYLESTLARADRGIGKVILDAYKNGAMFDGWNEFFHWDIWLDSFEKNGIDHAVYGRKRDFDEPLPWDCLDMLVSREYLRKERIKAESFEITKECKQNGCTGCGIPGSPKDLRLAKPSELIKQPHEKVVLPEYPQNYTGIAYRICFAKKGWARFLSHRDCITLFEQALRRSGQRLRYSQGFTPRIRLSAGPAISLGYESDVEFFDVRLDEKAGQDDWGLVLDGFLPDGLNVLSCNLLKDTDFGISDFSAVYTYTLEPFSKEVADLIAAGIEKFRNTGNMTVSKKPDKKPFFDTDQWVKGVDWDGKVFTFKLHFVCNKPNLTAGIFLKSVIGLSDENLYSCLITKKSMQVE